MIEAKKLKTELSKMIQSITTKTYVVSYNPLAFNIIYPNPASDAINSPMKAPGYKNPH